MSEAEARAKSRFVPLDGPRLVEFPSEHAALAHQNLTDLLKWREIDFQPRVNWRSLSSQPVVVPAQEPLADARGSVPEEPAGYRAATVREPEPTPLRFGTDEMVLSGGIPAAAKICLVALLVLLPLGKFGYDRWNASSPAPASGGDPFLAVGEGGWSTEWASDVAGSQLGRQLTLYRPSARLANYRVDFEGRIQRGGLGWVFRASDSANYYATKIRLDREGAAFRASLVRWAVIDRKPGPATEKRISMPAGADTVYRVRLDVAGPKFTFYLQDQAVDMWTDQRLKTGGFGFMNDRNEQGQILRVRMSYPEGAGNRNRASSP